jgi:ell wall binding domain 2 (CWB2)
MAKPARQSSHRQVTAGLEGRERARRVPGGRTGTLLPVLRRPALACLLALVAPTLAACGGGTGSDTDAERRGPQVGVRGAEPEAAQDLGFPGFATKNTTRVGAADSVATAAAVARAVFPGVEADTRPKAVALVDDGDWRAGVAAAALMADPVGAPLLLSEEADEDLPAATADALDALSPTGSRQVGNAQVLRIGDVPEVEGRRSTDVTGADAFEIASRIDALLSAARGRTSDRVVIAGSEQPEYAMPAAGWAAKSGDPVLFTERDRLPGPTREALARHQQPKIYVLGDEQVVSARVERELRRLGTVRRIDGGRDAVRNAIAFSRFVDGAFGWGVVDPGHGLVFVNAERPLDAAAAAPLSASGSYGPILLHTGGSRLPQALESYLLDIQPGFRRDPVRGVYNHGWVIGDEEALPLASQSRIDALLEIVPVDTDSPPSS